MTRPGSQLLSSLPALPKSLTNWPIDSLMINNFSWLWLESVAQRGMQLLAEKEPARAQAELERAREVFTRLSAQGRHSDGPGPGRDEIESGARLELEEDGSVFAHQDHPGRFDTYRSCSRPN